MQFYFFPYPCWHLLEDRGPATRFRRLSIAPWTDPDLAANLHFLLLVPFFLARRRAVAQPLRIIAHCLINPTCYPMLRIHHGIQH
jgi:hypothetical protein